MVLVANLNHYNWIIIAHWSVVYASLSPTSPLLRSELRKLLIWIDSSPLSGTTFAHSFLRRAPSWQPIEIALDERPDIKAGQTARRAICCWVSSVNENRTSEFIQFTSLRWPVRCVSAARSQGLSSNISEDIKIVLKYFCGIYTSANEYFWRIRTPS